jgi:hypothetical protein
MRKELRRNVQAGRLFATSPNVASGLTLQQIATDRENVRSLYGNSDLQQPQRTKNLDACGIAVECYIHAKSKALRVLALKPKGVGFVMKHRPFFEFARLIGIVAVSALITAAVQVTASEGGEGRSAGATVRSAAHTVADASLRKTAAALPKIRQINAEMIQALSRADSQKQRRKIVSKAKDKQLVALDEAGITAHQYEETIIAAENNPQLFAKLEEYVNTEQTC